MGISSSSSDQVCDRCGRPLDDGPGGHRGPNISNVSGQGGSAPFLLDPFEEAVNEDDSSRREESAATRSPRFGRRAVLAGAGIVAVVAVGLGSLVGALSNVEPPANEESDAVFDGDNAGVFDRSDPQTSESEGRGRYDGDANDSSGDSSQPTGGDPNFPPGDEHMEADEISALFAGGLGDGDLTYGVAYVGDDGLQTVGPWGTGQPEIEIARTLDQAIGNPLISNGAMTWAIDEDDPQMAYIVSNRFEVVATELSGNLAFIRKEKGRVEIGLTAYGGRQSGVQIPPMSDVVTVAGRGLLVAPATGGTYVVDSTGGMSRLNEDRVVSAGLDSEVYQRCDEVLMCETYAVVPDSQDERTAMVLSLEADSAVSMSPDGSHVAGLSGDDRELSLVQTDTGELVSFGEETILATGWAPDSSFLAVAVPGRLLIIHTDGREALSIALPTDPVSNSLLVFVV